MLNSKLRKVIDSYYMTFGNMDVIKIANSRSIKVDWVLEAGCHDGSDTVELFKSLCPSRYLAFEPDETARIKAEQLFESHSLTGIELHPFGLSDSDRTVFLKYEAEGKGSGSTHFSDVGEDTVQICRFDKHFKIEQNSGLLWLDVEGHATQAIKGMSSNLKSIALARVEVQLHTRNGDFQQDFKEVIFLMRNASLIPIYGPIHPSFFGDIIFVRSSLLSMTDKIRSRLLMFHLYFLHAFLYPIINKPTTKKP
jgi:FkbM family methyltransferase